jgi:uncharacterized iron-regulated protein
MVPWLAAALLSACTPKPAMLKIEGIETPMPAQTIVDTHTGRSISFDELIGQLAEVRVVYVGERHTDMAQHRIQLKIIQALVDRGRNIRVGMEMFDHTYQHVLDLWSAGDLTWENFLKRSHWYANWRYDDALYKDILVYIQQRHLKLIGLNIPFCIPPKIAAGGLDSLSAADRAQLPRQIDTGNAAHRAYIKEIFTMHHLSGREDFESFYEAQCAWEDGMAQAVADNLDDAAMVVLAGNGHITHKFGIPDRAFRRSRASFYTVYLAAPGTNASKADGDFIWVTPASASRPHMGMP